MKPTTDNVRPVSEACNSPVIPALSGKWAGFGLASVPAKVVVDPTPLQARSILKAPVLIFDVETNGKDWPETKFVGVGVCRDDKELFWFRDLKSEAWFEMAYRFEEVKLVGHNVRSDINWLHDLGIGATENQIYWDTLIASYAENPNKDHYHGLKDIARTELGLEWPTLDEMCKRQTGVKVNKKNGEEKPVISKFNLEEIYQQHPEEVIAYNAFDLIATARLLAKQQSTLTGQRRIYHDQLELPFSYVVSAMELKGIRVDRDGLKKLEQEKVKTQEDLLTKLKGMAGKDSFNPGSPKQVLELLQARGLDVKKTDEEELRPLSKKDPFIACLLEYRGVSKLLGTYLRPLIEHSDNPWSRVRTHFNQTVTVTGRLSSSKPLNLQNQPPEVKPYFIPDPGNLFVCADYSQIDLRSLGHLSKEPVYVEAFKTGAKVHQAVADKFRVEYKLGKIMSLALAYNGGPGRLMQECQAWGYDINYYRAKQLFQEFKRELWVLEEWKQREYDRVQRTGYVVTLLGRVIALPYPKAADYAVPGEYAFAVKHWQNCVIAFQGQGGTGDIVKAGMLRLHRRGYVCNAQVHDEVLLEVKAEEAEKTKEIVKQELESAAVLSVPLLAEVGIGDSWQTAKPQ
jgi:DNA polymerase I